MKVCIKKSTIIPVVMAILVISTGGLAAFSVQAISTIKQNNSQLSALKNDMAAMRTLTSSISSGTSVADLVTLIEPGVVRIDVTGSGFEAEGSGFIVDRGGYVITNNHVIENAQSVTATLATGTVYPATVVDADANRDLALIKITSTRTDFPVIKLGSASDAAVGDALLIGGFPLGLELTGPATFTQGIVSAIRTINGLTYIQTDAPINPGNSGGPAIGMQGTLLGVCVATVTGSDTTVEGLGLVIPVGDILKFIDSGKIDCTNCHYSA